MNHEQIAAPAPRPCDADPYRLDAPSGIWAPSEYEKLIGYDAPTAEQPKGLFLCHLSDPKSGRLRICAGWAGCHDGDHLLALRLAVLEGQISLETAETTRDYRSPVPLFGSGKEAAAHGMRDIEAPGDRARRASEKIVRARSDIAASMRE
ncbi:DUF6283 family protein [Lentzea sp. NPDC042327]|uniref:DUF6283 family protein n=1 Tax=Lentzea sp. NPDC042327 TaxID=3154801 RepID=UPI0033DCC4FF